jgi:uncharacterized OB-fold protein
MSATLATTLPPESIQIVTDRWTKPYWEAAKDERLVAPRCATCGTFRFPPTPFCPSCRSSEINWVTLGQGTVFSYSVVRGLPGHADIVLVPVVVQFADAPGVHVVSNVVDIPPELVAIGMPLEVQFITIAHGWKLPIFHAASPA